MRASKYPPFPPLFWENSAKASNSFVLVTDDNQITNRCHGEFRQHRTQVVVFIYALPICHKNPHEILQSIAAVRPREGDTLPPAMSDGGAGAKGAGFGMPRVGMGTAVQGPRPEPIRRAVLKAIEAGYRHFDTAAHYETEAPIGEAAAEAVRSGAIASRADLFITSKLWCSDAHRDRVLPALRQTLWYVCPPPPPPFSLPPYKIPAESSEELWF